MSHGTLRWQTLEGTMKATVLILTSLFMMAALAAADAALALIP